MLMLIFWGSARFAFNVSHSVDWVEARHSHFWREGPFVCAEALGECRDGQHDAH